MQDIVEIALSLIESARPGLCATLFLFSSGEDGESPESCPIAVHAGGAAPRGELLRIDDHFHRDAASRLEFGRLLFGRLLPLIERPGELWNVRYEASERFVILATPSGCGPLKSD